MFTMEMQLDALMRLCAADKQTDRDRAREEVRRMLLGRGAPAADPEHLTRCLLLELGAPDHLIGHPYMVEAIVLVVADRSCINSITFGLYPQVAAKFGTTASRVERGMRNLIEVTWTRGDYDVLFRYFGNTVSPGKGRPTNGEFIARCANIVRQQLPPVRKGSGMPS